MANVKVFVDKQTNVQTDKQMGQKLYVQGHKKGKCW